MNPIKTKLTKSYLLSKVEKLITEHYNTEKIANRKTSGLIQALEKYVTDNHIINGIFWGFGINRLTDGVQVKEKASLAKSGFLLMLFKIEKDYLKFYPILLNFYSCKAQEMFNPFELKLKFIKSCSYTPDNLLRIFSNQLDDVLEIIIDNNKNASYYTYEIIQLKQTLSSLYPSEDDFPVSLLTKEDQTLNNTALIEPGQVTPETKPTIQNKNIKSNKSITNNKLKESRKRDIQWFISALIALAILTLGYLNYSKDNYDVTQYSLPIIKTDILVNEYIPDEKIFFSIKPYFENTSNIQLKDIEFSNHFFIIDKGWKEVKHIKSYLKESSNFRAIPGSDFTITIPLIEWSAPSKNLDINQSLGLIRYKFTDIEREQTFTQEKFYELNLDTVWNKMSITVPSDEKILQGEMYIDSILNLNSQTPE